MFKLLLFFYQACKQMQEFLQIKMYSTTSWKIKFSPICSNFLQFSSICSNFLQFAPIFSNFLQFAPIFSNLLHSLHALRAENHASRGYFLQNHFIKLASLFYYSSGESIVKSQAKNSKLKMRDQSSPNSLIFFLTFLTIFLHKIKNEAENLKISIFLHPIDHMKL